MEKIGSAIEREWLETFMPGPIRSQVSKYSEGISMNPKDSVYQDVIAFCDLIKKSEGTLRIINIVSDDWLTRRLLSEVFWKMPAAIEFRVTDGKPSNTQLIQSPEVQEGVTADHSSRLKILSIETIDILPKSYSSLTANLASLSLRESISASKWREILAGPSVTLKHLGMRVNHAEDAERSGITLLLFPKLQVLEFFYLDIHDSQLPRWMSAPQLSSLVTNSLHTSLVSTSSVSLLWIDGVDTRVSDTFPNLSQLIYQPLGLANYSLLGSVIQMLIQRFPNVAAKMQVDGVEMRQIQKLVLPSKYLNDNDSPLSSLMMSHLRGMVDEVVAFESESRIIKVEI